VIRVGGATEVEVKVRKDRVDDAMHATRAAVNMMSKGIIDPTKVVRAALQGAASVARPAHHHRGHGGRVAEEDPTGSSDAGWRRNGFLTNRSEPPRRQQ
jgi:hypothetical protein